jgi:dynein heavy chain
VASPQILILFPARWAANNWPSKILGQIDMVRQQHVEDEEKFRKIQLMDQNNFQEKLEGLQVGLGLGLS